MLFTFERLAEEANKNNIKVIIISGDMFDTKSLTKKSKEYILNIFKNHSEIDFIYTSGNHDESNFFFDLEELPSNFKMFDNEWKTYSYDDLMLYGTPLKVKEAGKVRLEGKEYVVQDGDIMLFRFNI